MLPPAQVVLGGEQEAGVQQQVPLYNVFPSPGLTITTQPGPELASPPPTLPSLLSSLDTTTTMSQVRPSAGDQLMSHVTLVQRFQFPASSTPALPPYLGHYPALTPEQLGYLRLLNQGLNINPALGQLGQGAALGQLGQGGLGQLGQLGGQLRQGPQFTTIVNSQIKTTSVTLTESEEYRWVWKNI